MLRPLNCRIVPIPSYRHLSLVGGCRRTASDATNQATPSVACRLTAAKRAVTISDSAVHVDARSNTNAPPPHPSLLYVPCLLDTVSGHTTVSISLRSQPGVVSTRCIGSRRPLTNKATPYHQHRCTETVSLCQEQFLGVESSPKTIKTEPARPWRDEGRDLER